MRTTLARIPLVDYHQIKKVKKQLDKDSKKGKTSFARAFKEWKKQL